MLFLSFSDEGVLMVLNADECLMMLRMMLRVLNLVLVLVLLRPCPTDTADGYLGMLDGA